MMDSIHVKPFFTPGFTFQGGKKILHGDATNRILTIFAVIGDASDLYCGCLPLRTV
jgi:hypothetical protein